MSAIDKFREMFIKATAVSGDPWLEKIPAITGKADGTVLTDTYGIIWVRDYYGQPIEVFNSVVPAEPYLFINIGRRKDQPELWQVIGRRDPWSAPASSNVMHHHWQHGFVAPDMLMIDKRQVIQLSAIVNDASAFTVQVYGAVVPTANGLVKVGDEVLDFSGYVPTAGAVYVTIEIDDDGVVSLHEGANFGSPLVADVAYYPQPEAGQYPQYVVLLYEGLESLSNDLIKPIMPLGVIAKSVGLQIHEAAADTPLDADEFSFWDVVDAVLKKITWANIKATLKTYFDTVYAALVHTHDASEITGSYRALTYEVIDDEVVFATEDGEATYELFELE